MSGAVSEDPWVPWLQLAAIGLGIAPREFWALSVKEWRAVLAGFSAADDAPLTQAEFAALRACYPDTDEGNHA